jgi:hypothetical protein
MGSVCFGHVTAIEELWSKPFAGNWSGSGTIRGSGDSEEIGLHTGDSMEMNAPWRIGDTRKQVVLKLNKYGSGDDFVIKYKKGTTIAECNGSVWLLYTGPFTHVGYIRLRVEK